MHLQAGELVIVVVLFALVSGLGFMASRWRRASHDSLEEWALAGRGFRSWTSWFVVGGDLYTAYTYVAVPALLFGSGAIGFYALPYVAIEYPLVFLIMIRLWSVSKAHGYVTAADFVRARFDSPTLALAVAVTGIVATMPYIALNLLGIQAVLTTIGINGHWPLIVAFAVLAAFTYKSGVRAPALIAFVKDSLVYLVIAVAIIYIPYKLGGWTHIFNTYNAHFKAKPPHTAALLTSANQWQYITLALGSAFAIFLYPHSVTGVLTTKNRAVIKRTLAALPIYSFILGLIALFGVMAIAGKIKPLAGPNGKPDTNTVVPSLFQHLFPHWFTGVAFATIVIGALVPAAFMSIAAANLTEGIEPPKSHWAQPIDTPPYYGIAMRPGITFTYMGVAVTQQARVLCTDGTTFANVFAAGEIMSGNILSTGNLAGFGLTIGSVWGRIAGEEAARHAHDG
jgi:SSS family solute:Na+ symporter